jgi:hypothetical protein
MDFICDTSPETTGDLAGRMQRIQKKATSMKKAFAKTGSSKTATSVDTTISPKELKDIQDAVKKAIEATPTPDDMLSKANNLAKQIQAIQPGNTSKPGKRGQHVLSILDKPLKTGVVFSIYTTFHQYRTDDGMVINKGVELYVTLTKKTANTLRADFKCTLWNKNYKEKEAISLVKTKVDNIQYNPDLIAKTISGVWVEATKAAEKVAINHISKGDYALTVLSGLACIPRGLKQAGMFALAMDQY